MNNPFEIIDRRLHHIEEMLINILHGQKSNDLISRLPGSLEIRNLNISLRAQNALIAAQIRYLSDLENITLAQLLSFRSMGQKSLAEIEIIMKEYGIAFKQQ